MKLKDLVKTLSEYTEKDVVVEVEQPNPFQLVITLNR